MQPIQDLTEILPMIGALLTLIALFAPQRPGLTLLQRYRARKFRRLICRIRLEQAGR